MLQILETLNAAQRERSISGSIAEIGVHHGKLFIALHLLQAPAETSLAIDLFEDQELNIDDSGRGDLERFRANLAMWTDNPNVAIHRGDSTQLSGREIRQMTDSPVRLFSVDGGHTEEIVQSDMRIAEDSLADGGIVIADDVFNPQWPGVVVGTIRYLDAGGRLLPFAVGFNKVFFAAEEFVGPYRAAIRNDFENRVHIARKTSNFLDHEVEILYKVRRSPRRLVRRNAAARAAYDALQRRRDHARPTT